MTTLNNRTINRIAFHTARAEDRTVRLRGLKEGSPSFIKCRDGIDDDWNLVDALKAQLASRLEAGKGEGPKYVPTKPRGERKGETFDVVVGDEPSSEPCVEFAYTCHNGVIGHRFDLVG